MLVLSREKDEKIIIQCGRERIEILVVDLGRFQCRLGFIASPEVIIHREEVVRMIEAEGDWERSDDEIL